MPKLGKAKRKNWRKVDIKDVEEALEDERAISKLKNKALRGDTPADEAEDLFRVDTTGSFEGVSKASRRAAARAKIFAPKPPNIGLSAFEEMKVARAEAKLNLKRKRPKAEPEVFDLWAEPSAEAKASAEAAKCSTVKRAPMQAPSKVPKTMREKVSRAPAVLPAHEGQSVNPVGTSYEELACLAAAKELEREAEVEALDRNMRPLTCELEDANGKEVVENWDEEEKVKAYRELVCQTAAGGEDAEEAFLRQSKAMRVKSQAQRNREKKRKYVDAKQAQVRQQKKLEKSVGDIGAIMKEIKAQEEFYENRRKYRQEQRKTRETLEATEGIVPKTRRLGHTRFREAAIAVPDFEAASKGLRAMPLQSGLAVKERLSSMRRRGIVPEVPESTRTQVAQQRAKVRRIKRKYRQISPLVRDNSVLKKRKR